MAEISEKLGKSIKDILEKLWGNFTKIVGKF